MGQNEPPVWTQHMSPKCPNATLIVLEFLFCLDSPAQDLEQFTHDIFQ